MRVRICAHCRKPWLSDSGWCSCGSYGRDILVEVAEARPSAPKPLSISYDPAYTLATFRGPGGFTQYRMPERQAEAIAQALGVRFVGSDASTSRRETA